MKKIKVGIIGCGTIGSALAKVLLKEFRDRATLAFLCELDREKVNRLKNQLLRDIPIVSLERLIRNSDLVWWLSWQGLE